MTALDAMSPAIGDQNRGRLARVSPVKPLAAQTTRSMVRYTVSLSVQSLTLVEGQRR
jgi:hypothetical protein